MSSLVQLRGVSDETHRALKARAAAQGKSLNAYLLEIVEQAVARPTIGEVMERAARRAEQADTSAADIIDTIRSNRDKQLANRTKIGQTKK